ncbi:MAG TPA: hypothetical protein VIU11_00195 [Nakamurella sp.]
MVSRQQDPIVGWLSMASTGQAWPGVLVHRDAFVVDAPTEVLHHPADLSVRFGAYPNPIIEILIIDDGPTDSGRATAMLRLTREEPATASVTLDRAAVDAGWRAGRPTWNLLQDQGVVPDRWPPAPEVAPAAVESAPIAVKTVQAAPADWCTIFWWLC